MKKLLFILLVSMACEDPVSIYVPPIDCFGVENGAAFIDDCGLCTGGTTSLNANYTKDECGVCFGDNSSCNEITETQDDCDPELLCSDAITCIDGMLYPSTCGPENCDLPISECESNSSELFRIWKTEYWYEYSDSTCSGDYKVVDATDGSQGATTSSFREYSENQVFNSIWAASYGHSHINSYYVDSCEEDQQSYEITNQQNDFSSYSYIYNYNGNSFLRPYYIYKNNEELRLIVWNVKHSSGDDSLPCRKVFLKDWGNIMPTCSELLE